MNQKTKHHDLSLHSLTGYPSVTIQCHDNPDADAIASGYGLYCYFTAQGIPTRFLYSGRNRVSKANLELMITHLNIPLTYIAPQDIEPVQGLLVMVDCQYGAGNVTSIPAEDVAVIDHHPLEVLAAKYMRIEPALGSCATLVWTMLCEEGFSIEENEALSTALYYGLYMDTNEFSELFHPVDSDMREHLPYDRELINLLRNSNISLKELEIAGIAMIRCSYNEEHQFAMIRSNPCDPNVLGLISDFLLRVAGVNTCVVFNADKGGYKFSVRSCIREVDAGDLADYLTENIGSGGGHAGKAGGYISRKSFTEHFPNLHSDAYFMNRCLDYLGRYEVLDASEGARIPEDAILYRRTRRPLLCVRAAELAELGDVVSVRIDDRMVSIDTREKVYYGVEENGVLHRMEPQIFHAFLAETGIDLREDYFEDDTIHPVVRDWQDGSLKSLSEYGERYLPTEHFQILAKRLDHAVKVFPKWDKEHYMVGNPGDYLAATASDPENLFIEPGAEFAKNFLPA